MGAPRWPDEHTDLLLDRAGVEPLKVIAARIGRSENAVKLKLQALGVKAADAQGLYSGRLAAREYHYAPDTVAQWIRRGKLKAVRGPNAWQIDPEELEKVLGRRCGGYTPGTAWGSTPR